MTPNVYDMRSPEDVAKVRLWLLDWRARAESYGCPDCPHVVELLAGIVTKTAIAHGLEQPDAPVDPDRAARRRPHVVLLVVRFVRKIVSFVASIVRKLR